MIPGDVRIVVCREPVDMRWGFDRLAYRAKSTIGEDPQAGGVLVVFGNRNATRLKILWFDRNGYCLLYKRLHRAVFEFPLPTDGGAAVRVDGVALAKLLAGVDVPDRRRRNRTCG